MSAIRLFIPGAPHGQGRPRITTRGGKPRTFTDKDTRSYAQRVQTEWIAAGRPTITDGFYAMRIEVIHERSAGHYLRDGVTLSAQGRRRARPGKPDLDNVVKGVLDALVAVDAVPDDRYLFAIWAHKRWAGRDEAAGVAVSFWDAPGAEEAA